MSIEKQLQARCEDKCELCNATTALQPWAVYPYTDLDLEHNVMLCEVCMQHIGQTETSDEHHWHCLRETMWTAVPAVQVVIWRQLNQLSTQAGWAMDLLESLYLDDETAQWANTQQEEIETPKDVNGQVLNKGDDVTVIKDLPIKGSSQVIKQGTVIRQIQTSAEDPTHVQGKVNGQAMYVIAAYCRKK